VLAVKNEVVLESENESDEEDVEEEIIFEEKKEEKVESKVTVKSELDFFEQELPTEKSTEDAENVSDEKVEDEAEDMTNDGKASENVCRKRVSDKVIPEGKKSDEKLDETDAPKKETDDPHTESEENPKTDDKSTADKKTTYFSKIEKRREQEIAHEKKQLTEKIAIIPPFVAKTPSIEKKPKSKKVKSKKSENQKPPVYEANWEELHTIPSRRFCADTVVINSKAFFFGGMFGDDDDTSHQNIAVYDLEGERFLKSIDYQNHAHHVVTKIAKVHVPNSYWTNKFNN
jgi:hypothetical protein